MNQRDWIGMNGLIDPILRPNQPNKPNHIKYSLDTSQHLIQHQQTPFHRQRTEITLDIRLAWCGRRVRSNHTIPFIALSCQHHHPSH